MHGTCELDFSLDINQLTVAPAYTCCDSSWMAIGKITHAAHGKTIDLPDDAAGCFDNNELTLNIFVIQRLRSVHAIDFSIQCTLHIRLPDNFLTMYICP